MRSIHVWRPAATVGCFVAVAAVATFACSNSNNGGGSSGSSSTSSSGGGSGGSSGSFASVSYTAPDGEVSPLESPGTCSGTTGGSVVGPPDDHCEAPDGGQIIQSTSAPSCTFAGDGGGGTAMDGGADDGSGGGMADANIGNCGDDDYGATMYNNWGSDDDCKYDVEWQSTPICENQPVYFTVVVTKREDNTPLEGVQTGGSFVQGNPRPDVVLDCDHPIPNSPAPRNPSPEIAPGTYVVGPIVFDKGGQWVFRFHFNEECLDVADDSPHGHAAFYINVP